MRPLPSANVFSRIDLRALGWSDSAIGRALQSGRLLRLRRDQYTFPGQPEAEPAPHGEAQRLAAIAAVRSCGGSVISHRSAATFESVPLYAVGWFVPDLTVQPGQTGDVANALLHRASFCDDDVIYIDGVPVTTPARTALDLARHLPLTSAVVALDYVLHQELATWDDLNVMAERCRRWPGMARARRALALADGRSESVLESVSRLVVVRIGLPKPRPQVRIYDESGLFLGRTDFFWDDFGVFGEADGKIKYTKYGETLDDEKARHESFEQLGLPGARWGWVHATRQTNVIRQRVEGAFERARYLRSAGYPCRWTVSTD